MRLVVVTAVIAIFTSTIAFADTESRCREKLSSGGWNVLLSHRFNEVDVAVVVGCIAFTGGAGTLPCLGQAVETVASTIGWSLLGDAIRNREKIVVSGDVQAQVGLCSGTYPIIPGIKGTDHYVYVRHRRTSGAPPTLQWHLIKNRDGGSCLDALRSHPSNFGYYDGNKHGNVYEWECHGGANQQWALESTGDGFYLIKNRDSGHCLDALRSAPSSFGKIGNIYEWGCHGGDNQKWRLQDIDSGFRLIINKDSNNCADALRGTNDNGFYDGHHHGNVYEYPCHNGANQQWYFEISPE
jgi:hypothetical protein